MYSSFSILKEVKELDGNIYVSMEFCNKEISKRDKDIKELVKEKAQLKAKLKTTRVLLKSLLNNTLKDSDKEWKLEYIGILVCMVFVENICGEVIKNE